MDISKRLKTVALAVTEGNRVADIGTDHGYVPIFLIKEGKCKNALAMDINAGPLERAVEHIRQEGLSQQITTRLSDGMKELQKNEADTVVIAGMGGDLICRILKAREDLLKGEDGLELILQPQSEWFKVRHTLHEYGYCIEKEWFLKEEGKYYVIMRARPGQQSFDKEYQYAYGAFLEEACTPVYKEYLMKEIEKREGIAGTLLRQMKNSEKNLSGKSQRVDELNMEISLLKERLKDL